MTEMRSAIAVVVRGGGGLVLAVKRPDEAEEELPGVWGLPATTLGEGEVPESAALRIGHEKLGVDLTLTRPLASGSQRRAGYVLHMTVYEASMQGTPFLQANRPGSGTQYEAMTWLADGAFADAARRGSLCCRLFLRESGSYPA